MNGLAVGFQMMSEKRTLGNVSWNWLFNTCLLRCCVIIVTTKARVSHTLTVMCLPISSGIDTHSRNSRSIIFGQGWMQKLETWAVAITSTFPPSDHIDSGKGISALPPGTADTTDFSGNCGYSQFAHAILCACNTSGCLSRLLTRYVNGKMRSPNS